MINGLKSSPMSEGNSGAKLRGITLKNNSVKD